VSIIQWYKRTNLFIVVQSMYRGTG